MQASQGMPAAATQPHPQPAAAPTAPTHLHQACIQRQQRRHLPIQQGHLARLHEARHWQRAVARTLGGSAWLWQHGCQRVQQRRAVLLQHARDSADLGRQRRGGCQRPRLLRYRWVSRLHKLLAHQAA